MEVVSRGTKFPARYFTIWKGSTHRHYFGTGDAAGSKLLWRSVLLKRGVLMTGSRNAAMATKTFGQDRSAAENLENLIIKRQLKRRINEKIKNYERAAAKLEIRGDEDSATVLNKAANRLRPIAANNANDPKFDESP